MVNLKKICESRLNLQIISFFHENRSILDTSRGIAAWLNHGHQEINEALDYLVNQNILISHRTGSTVAYGYTQSKAIIDEIEKFLQARQDLGGRDV